MSTKVEDDECDANNEYAIFEREEQWQYYTQQLSFQVQQSSRELQNASARIQQQEMIIEQLQYSLGEQNLKRSGAERERSRLGKEMKKMHASHQRHMQRHTELQADNRIAWKAVQNIGELFTKVRPETGDFLSEDEAATRKYVTELVIVNAKREGEIYRLHELVERLKKFRLLKYQSIKMDFMKPHSRFRPDDHRMNLTMFELKSDFASSYCEYIAWTYHARS